MIKLIQVRSASALLLSFFLMSMLIVISLGVNYLVNRDLIAMRTVIAGMQANYAAEGMSEIGLYMVKKNLPGYEEKIERSLDYFDATQTSLNLYARSDVIPCENQSNEEYLRLSKNESVQLPLFYQNTAEDDAVTPVLDFVVEFYIGDNDGNPIQGSLNIDVLRWKIIGFSMGGNTEAISEFIPPHPSIAITSLGTEAFVADPQYRQGKYTSGGGFTANMEISSFLDTHEYNYLVLTNVFEKENYFLYYRLRSQEENLPCPYVEVNSLAVNEWGESRQSITTFMREGENLPAYDFVLYNTDNDDTSDTSSQSIDPILDVGVSVSTDILDSLGLTLGF